MSAFLLENMCLIIINSTCRLNKMHIRICDLVSEKGTSVANCHLLQTQKLVRQNHFSDEKKFFHFIILYYITSIHNIIYLVQSFSQRYI